MEQKPIIPPVDQRDVAFEALRTIISEAPLKPEYKIKIVNALIAYVQTLN
jgi:hypothetical protein